MTRTRTRIWISLVMAAVCLIAMLPAACTKAPAGERPETPQDEVARLQRNITLLQRQAELAGGKDFYLLLDPAASELTLMLSGAELQRYQVLGIQVGQPRVAWFGREDPRPWKGVTWSKGELDPPRQIDRLVLQAAEPSKTAAEAETPPIPPTPEEMYPVPSRYHVRFDDGLSVEIRPREADAETGRFARLRASWSAKWRDVVAALRSRDRDAVRLRLVLKPKDADSLYRSLPPAVKLLVLEGAKRTPAAPPAKPGAPASKTPAAQTTKPGAPAAQR
ncbi:MAG: hypothetical protein NTY02_06385 [Acidobacteria bacterium]|nr:hypothetical protein [Acidobacteriota bacterium]